MQNGVMMKLSNQSLKTKPGSVFNFCNATLRSDEKLIAKLTYAGECICIIIYYLQKQSDPFLPFFFWQAY